MVLLEKYTGVQTHTKKFEIHWAHVHSHFTDKKTEGPSRVGTVPRTFRRAALASGALVSCHLPQHWCAVLLCDNSQVLCPI